jgi:hypothetical protein
MIMNRYLVEVFDNDYSIGKLWVVAESQLIAWNEAKEILANANGYDAAARVRLKCLTVHSEKLLLSEERAAEIMKALIDSGNHSEADDLFHLFQSYLGFVYNEHEAFRFAERCGL